MRSEPIPFCSSLTAFLAFGSSRFLNMEFFSYCGRKGTQNNFLSKQDCERTCYGRLRTLLLDNPCALGQPQMTADNRPQTCSASMNTCGAGFWCHFGANQQTTVCCPGRGEWHRLQAVEVSLQLVWFCSNRTIFHCERNSFLEMTREDARSIYGKAYCREQKLPLFSLAKVNCPSSRSPHPSLVEGQAVCQQSLALGNGDAALPRWYYDATSLRCVQFFYRGRYGNQNNFMSQEECEQTCPVYVNVCPVGNPLLDSSNRPVPCTFGTNSCGSGYWCHLGLCCPGEPTDPGACQGLPEQRGELGAPAQPATRYYYDQTEMTCKQFIFNGRKGNQNNFLTLEDCEQTCNGESACATTSDGPLGSVRTSCSIWMSLNTSFGSTTLGFCYFPLRLLDMLLCESSFSVFTNPCNQPIPLPPQMCAASGPDTCGASSWCHIGATPDTTLCCPSEGDPCSLPLNRGTGNQFMDRWYYNQQAGSCQPFTYAGLRGNQNNFLTRESCEERCGPNPCFEGRPFAGVDGRPQTCSISANLNTCPASYWCHIGADMSTTVCCPGASTNICNLPMSTGEGNYNLERYYFDQSSKTCRPFVYNGLKGNQNNFITLRACQLSCQPLDNPCIGQPATTAAGQVLFCSSTNKDTCPVNFWCHLGATPETTVCCPGATNACSVPLAPGTGNAGLSRWYYNPDDRQCLPFQYNGKRGNQNNFETQSECERTCPVFVNPCLGEVFRDERGAPQTCNPMIPDPCPTGSFCLPGDPATKNSSYCCPQINQDPCDSSWSEGEGEDSLNRFYYNPVEGDCYPFTYKGRRGNENNFLTKKLCQEKCMPITSVCFGGELPLTSPSGRVVQCHNQPCPDDYYCHLGKDIRSTVCCEKKGTSHSPCDQQLMLGVGDSLLPRFYYDPLEDRCLPFNYTGIGGNENNFATMANCQIACPGAHRHLLEMKVHVWLFPFSFIANSYHPFCTRTVAVCRRFSLVYSKYLDIWKKWIYILANGAQKQF
ncbi:unnamed protein product [Heligmosomoides polygyrus]|uniref:Kunitz/Bovine pancreatic trypsin inhibitor domain protein n=1 Tax=Heligmosomoides polygyrus TaxID=6339 RepID=A0A3P7ZWC9_HELPZ|nr:unnamed protein product [Heligmosomoides polygyrus]